MTDGDLLSGVRRKYQDLCLDLNLDQATADEAWTSYQDIHPKYILEGEQLTWLACSLYTACRRRSVPTVGGRPGIVIQGNCVSLTRMLQSCSLPLTEFIKKMKSWLAMSHSDESLCRRVDLLERNFAVSNNIFKKYKPIFLDLFCNPADDPMRPPRSRKQRRPPCNATELFNFCWTLYTLIKGKYPSIPQDLVSCYSLLLASVDLMYRNVVLADRRDLLNPNCQGLPQGLLEENANDLTAYPESIMDYLCQKFDGVLVETKVVREYYWIKNIRDLIDRKVLKGNVDGTALVEQAHFDHNVKEVKKCYEEYLLNCGEFDERMFLQGADVARPSVSTPPRVLASYADSPNESRTARRNLVQSFEGDHHLVMHTPITGRRYTIDRPSVGSTPLTVVTSGLQKLYALLAGRKSTASDELLGIFRACHENPEERIQELVDEMSQVFCSLYTQSTEDYSGPSLEFAKLRLQMGQMLYFTFLEHIIVDEQRRGVDLEAILKEELFHKTLFTCCLEIILKSYNDPRRFPWTLQVSQVEPYYFIRIIEPVIRSEKQSNNQLSRELVKHLKGIEEQILDSLAWRETSPLWRILETNNQGVPSCQDVNFSDQLEVELGMLTPGTGLMSPSRGRVGDRSVIGGLGQSPISTVTERFQSPVSQTTARRTLFPSSFGGTASHVPGSPTMVIQRPQSAARLGFSPNSQSLLNSSHKITLQVKGTNVTTLLTMPAATDSNVSNNGISISALESVVGAIPNTDKRKEKPRRNGSLALFFRKFYTLANMRLRDLCDRLDINERELRRKIWTCFEHSVIHRTEILRDRHLDQVLMCAVYIMCKVTSHERIFQEIMKHYRNQPQAASHVYRSVLISRSLVPAASLMKSEVLIHPVGVPLPTPGQVTGSSATFDGKEERGDLIKFYNQVYVHYMKAFALKFRGSYHEGDLPPLSPLPMVRHTPVSPRRRISTHHSVFINSLSPMTGNTAVSPRKPLPYYFNRSPAKDLRVINSMLKMQQGASKRLLSEGGEAGVGGCPEVKRCLLGGLSSNRVGRVLDDRLSAMPSTGLEDEEDDDMEEGEGHTNGMANAEIEESIE